LSALGANIRRA